MIRLSIHELRVLAIDPVSRGFGFVVMEGPQTLIDWGVKSTRRDKQATSQEKLADLISTYHPTYLIIENFATENSRRCRRIQRLLRRLAAVGTNSGVRVRRISNADVKAAFALHGASTKNQIALVIGGQFPELAAKVPPYRKPWMTEDYQMPVFDAAALALTFLIHNCGHPVMGRPPEADQS